ncbi:hypothetical protein DFJ73DRAFT_757983 [Zopfochytrium polystomum]|nr:hypothetical protein DFJ73DRAFT_757983 [Zopfochytrium polystomum]
MSLPSSRSLPVELAPIAPFFQDLTHAHTAAPCPLPLSSSAPTASSFLTSSTISPSASPLPPGTAAAANNLASSRQTILPVSSSPHASPSPNASVPSFRPPPPPPPTNGTHYLPTPPLPGSQSVLVRAPETPIIPSRKESLGPAAAIAIELAQPLPPPNVGVAPPPSNGPDGRSLLLARRPASLDVDRTNVFHEISRYLFHNQLFHAPVAQVLDGSSLASSSSSAATGAVAGEDHGVLNDEQTQQQQQREQHKTEELRGPPLVLDVGCGLGSWAFEVAARFPNAKIVAVVSSNPEKVRVFRSPIPVINSIPQKYQRRTEKKDNVPGFAAELAATAAPVPQNVSLVEADVVAGLPFPDSTFDFTFQRSLLSTVRADRWPAVVRELKRVTKPGGWIELVEPYGGFQRKGPVAAKLDADVLRVQKKFGIDRKIALELDASLTDAGLIDVREDMQAAPICWNGHLGSHVWICIRQGILSFRPFLLHRSDAASPDGEAAVAAAAAFDAVLDRLEREFAERQSFWNWYCAWGKVVK